MKKMLSLLLAVVMVLALVPAAFAATTTLNSSSYKVTANLTYKDNPYVETYETTFTAEGQKPELKIDVPYSILASEPSTDIWDNATAPKIALTIASIGGGSKVFGENASAIEGNLETVKINGSSKTFTGDNKAVTITDDGLTFNMGGMDSASKTYLYEIELIGKTVNGNNYAEKMSFTVQFANTEKTAYDLKVNSIDGATLKDGIWYIDTAAATFAAGKELTFDLRKNDGSKFDTKAYYSVALGTKNATDAAYAKVTTDNALDSNKTAAVLVPAEGTPADGDKYQIALRVETQYAAYETKINVKFRTNVAAVDPKGVFFGKDSYTIKVNEVFQPTYTYIVDPLLDIKSDITLEQTAYAEKNVIDIDNNKIIGLKEGTAYVKLSYTYTGVEGEKTYTDTAKVIVSGVYTVAPDANYYVVTTTGRLNMRAAASTKSAIVGKLNKGDVIQVVEIKNGWAKCVNTANYSNYYVSASYITLQNSEPTSGTRTVIARCLNVRAGAGTSYKIAGHLYRNNKVEVIETVANGSWSKISFNGNTCYVASRYLQ